MDGELAGLMADEFEQRGVRLILGAGTDGVARIDGRLRVTLSTGAVLATDTVLFAAGRPPNTERLGLAEAGVQLDARGRIVVDRYYRTSAAGISADDRKLLGIHCLGDIASEVVGLGHVVLHVGGTVEVFLTLALNTPTYTYAYHDAAVDGLTRLAELMGHDVSMAVPPPVMAAAGR
jgi:pyruvate/2-oxoglutarate dehydrogenase complex dihydrolipoamide dehydrogenase (E3) component